MAKQAKMKKGSIGKKALAAILAASMVLSSSAFTVFAGPNEDNGIMTISTYERFQLTTNLPSDKTVSYKGSAWEPEVILTGTDKETSQQKTFVRDVDYTVKYENNIEAGSNATISVEALPGGALSSAQNDLSSAKETFTIGKLTLSKTNTTVEWRDVGRGFNYDGKDKTPVVTSVKVSGMKGITGDYVLPENLYEVVVYNDVNGDRKYDSGDNEANEHSDVGNYVAGIQIPEELGDSNNIDIAASTNGVNDNEANVKPFIITQSDFNVTVENNVFPYTPDASYVKDLLDNIVVKDATSGEVLNFDKSWSTSSYNSSTNKGDYILRYDWNGETPRIPKEIGVGTHKLTIESTGHNYKSGIVTANYRIEASSLQTSADNYIKNLADAAQVFGSSDSGFTYDKSKGKIVVTYTGGAIKPSDTGITHFLTQLGAKTGMTINSSNCDVNVEEGTDVGTYNITLSGKENLSGTAVIPYEIVPAEITSSMIKKGFVGSPGEGKASSEANLTIEFTSSAITSPAYKLEAGKDFDYTVGTVGTASGSSTQGVKYDSNGITTLTDNNKYAKVTIEGKGNFTTVNATQTKLDVNVEMYKLIDLESEDVVANVVPNEFAWKAGEQVTPSKDQVIVSYKGELLKGAGKDTTEASGADIDYTISYPLKTDDPNNIDAGEGIVTIEGKVGTPTAITSSMSGDSLKPEGFYGTRKLTFTIVGTDINDDYKLAPIDDITFDTTDPNYTNKVFQSGKLKLLFKSTGNEAVPDGVVDFTKAVYYINGKEQASESAAQTFMSTAAIDKCPYLITIEVPGRGKYSNKLTVSYNVNAKDGANIVAEPIPNMTYDGTAKTPDVTVYEDNSKAKLLAKGIDYDVDYSQNTNAGIGVVILTFKGSYTGTKLVPFVIEPADATVALDADQKSSLESGVAAGSSMELKLTPSIKDDTLSYNAASDDTSIVSVSGTTLKFEKAGSANVVITPTSSNLNLTPATITVAVKVTGTVSSGIKTPTITLSRKVSTKKKTFTVTTSKVAGATKWQVQYSLKSTRKANGDLKSNKTKTYASNKTGRLYRKVITCNKSGKKYYVRVRAYVNGDWSAWSDSAEGLESIKTR